jgi:tRNA(Ile)-lysidine synthase
MLARGTRVLAAVSGGADSTALAWLLAELDARKIVTLAGLAHLNHQLRGDAADRDEDFCRALAARVGVPFECEREDVGAEARTLGVSVEVAARGARYAFLARAADKQSAVCVATGHTLDDQAETVLLRLLRGAGNRGHSGIRPVRETVIRPLIDCRRTELRDYLAHRGETFREDASNADVAIPRNRVRHELLPVIERMAPGGLAALARSASLAADDEDFLEAAAIIAASDVVLVDGDGVQLNVAALARLAPAIARRVIRGAIERVSGSEVGRLTAAHIEAVRNLDAGHLDLAGVRIDRVGERLKVQGTKMVGLKAELQ